MVEGGIIRFSVVREAIRTSSSILRVFGESVIREKIMFVSNNIDEVFLRSERVLILTPNQWQVSIIIIDFFLLVNI